MNKRQIFTEIVQATLALVIALLGIYGTMLAALWTSGL